jgi:hypothetical protein
MTFLTAVHCHVDAAVAYRGADTEKYLGEVDNLSAPLLMHLERRTSSFPRPRKLRSRQHLPAKQTRRFTAIRGSVTPSLVIMGRTTTPRRQRSPTGGQANFYIDNYGEFGGSSENRNGQLDGKRPTRRLSVVAGGS